MRFHCMFEQSGTFKNEFKKLGYLAYDYDLLNMFNETDYIIDLFNEIECAYERESVTIFDKFNQNDFVIAFFPCVRFEDQILLSFRGENQGMRKWTDEKKLKYDLKLMQELNRNYQVITKLVLLALRYNFKLIIENPYSSQHFLTRYWSIKPAYIDMNRYESGDYCRKPTQYFFINCEPQNNLLFEPINYKIKKTIEKENTVNRSIISSDYASRFIREFILKKDDENNFI